MSRYILQFENGTTAVAWEHSFQMATDGMAVSYARKVAEHDPAVKEAKAILLWTTEADAVDALLARFTRLPVQVVDTVNVL